MKRKLLITIVLSIIAAVSIAALVGCNSSALQLSDPENVKYDGTTITWNAVENADSYSIKINDGEEYKVTVPSYPYDARDTQFTVTVRAVSNASKIVQSGETVKTFAPLGKIDEIIVADDGSISWNVVENATGYLVRVDNVELDVPVTTPSFAEIQEGTHSVQVRPIVTDNNSYYSKWSDAKSITILAAVAKDKITYSDGKISWGYVSGARYYEVSVNGNILTSECTATEYVYDAQNKDFEVTVKAIGNRTSTFDGKVSEVKKFVYLDTVTNMTVEDGIVQWSAIAGADGYKLKLNGIERSEILREPKFDNLTANVTTDIQVKPISDDSTYFSDWSVVKSVLILPAPILQWNSDYELDGQANSNTYWDGIASASGYAIRLTNPDGTQKVNTYGETQRFFQEAFLQVGTYKVEAKSLATTSGSNIYDSVYSTPIIVTRLAAPTAPDNNYITSNPNNVGEGFTVTFSQVSGASGYRLYRDNVEAQLGTTNQFAVRDVVSSSVTDQQSYNFKIQSTGSVRTVGGQINATLNSLSEESLSFMITVLATPQNTDMSGFVFSYGSIEGNNGYVVDVQGQSFTSGGTEYDLSLLEAGVYNVSVCAKGNGTTVLASNYSAPIQVYRLEAPTNIHIETSDASEGVLGYTTVQNASGYYIVFNNDGNAIPVSNMMNINQYITEQGTTVYMLSSANYFNDQRTIYYMTSQPSTTANFIKLATPLFGDVAFSNTQLIWNAPSNINTSIYTPTYEVYYANGTLYNGEKNGTTMNIAYLDGGASYTFYVKAIGNGTNYVNSEKSQPVTIWKLATPSVSRSNGQYTWSGVVNATNYAVYVDGTLAATFAHESGKSYSYTPQFNQLKTYQVDVYAVGDGGYTSIDSTAAHIDQQTKQLSTPDFSFSYSDDHYSLDGTINVTITKESPYATGYSYTVGGVTNTSSEKTYSHMPSSVGTFAIRVFALGGAFDEDGVYYLDSQSRGGNQSYSITLLAVPNESSITLTADGFLSWTPIAGAVGYEVVIAVDGQPIGEAVTVSNASYTISDYSQYVGHSITVTIRAKGNGTTSISSETVTHTWDMI